MISYAVYVKGRFIKYFNAEYNAFDFVSSCLFVMHVLGIYEPAESELFEIKEEET